MPPEILILEDNADRREVMQECLSRCFAQYNVWLFATAGEFIDHVRRRLQAPILICLDHDLDLIPIADKRMIDPGSGRDVCDFLATIRPTAPIIIHSSNAVAVYGMTEVLNEAGWQVHRVFPQPDLDWIRREWLAAVRNAIAAS